MKNFVAQQLQRKPGLFANILRRANLRSANMAALSTASANPAAGPGIIAVPPSLGRPPIPGELGLPSQDSASLNTASQSIWIGLHRGGKVPSFPKLTGADPTEFDVVIVGAGIVGLSSAWTLQQHGLKVCVVEGTKVASGVSSYSTSKISAQHMRIYSALQKKGGDLSRKYAALQYAGLSLCDHIVKSEGIECAFARKPHALYTWTPSLISALKEEHQAALNAGITDAELTVEGEALSTSGLKDLGGVSLQSGDLTAATASASAGGRVRVDSAGGPGLVVENASVASDLPRSMGVVATLAFPNQIELNIYSMLVGLADKLAMKGVRIFEDSRVVDVTGLSDLPRIPIPGLGLGGTGGAGTTGPTGTGASEPVPSSSSSSTAPGTQPSQPSSAAAGAGASNSLLHTVSTLEGSVKGRYVILATHLPIADRSLHFAILEPSQEFVIAVARKKEAASLSSSSSSSSAPLINNMYINLESDQVRSLRSGGVGAEDILVIAGNDMPFCDFKGDPRAAFTELETWARQHFPVDRVVSRHQAFDYISSDGRPFIGKAHRLSDTILTATGFSKWGLSNGLGASLILRDYIYRRDQGKATAVGAAPVVATASSSALPASIALGATDSYADAFAGERWDALSLKGLVSETAHTLKHFVPDKVRHALQQRDVKTLAPGEGDVFIDSTTKEKIAAYRDPVSGKLAICSGTCTHLGTDLVFSASDVTFSCPSHGSIFNVDGEVLHGPACKALQKIAVDW